MAGCVVDDGTAVVLRAGESLLPVNGLHSHMTARRTNEKRVPNVNPMVKNHAYEVKKDYYYYYYYDYYYYYYYNLYYYYYWYFEQRNGLISYM